MSRPGLAVLNRVLWPVARVPVQAAARVISTARLALASTRSRIQRRIEAKLRDALFISGLAMAGLVLGAAGAIFLLMALWGGLAAFLGPVGASLTLGLALVVASIPPLAMAGRRATRRGHVRD